MGVVDDGGCERVTTPKLIISKHHDQFGHGQQPQMLGIVCVVVGELDSILLNSGN